MGLGNNPLATEGDRFIKNTLDTPRGTPKPAPAVPVGAGGAGGAMRDTEPGAYPDALPGTPRTELREARQGRAAKPKIGKHVKSFSLDEHLVQRLRAYAFHEEEKASAVVSRALHQYLADRGY
ncbi:hypothetical protein [Megalodesulfovibrio paquesii]